VSRGSPSTSPAQRFASFGAPAINEVGFELDRKAAALLAILDAPVPPALTTQVKILVIGAGATGGYFAARLARAGRDVTFLAARAAPESCASEGCGSLGSAKRRS
jgi:NADPH-dependent 2,4-dienoyl-CoA reductase/sulfur reductase-like enzyme